MSYASAGRSTDLRPLTANETAELHEYGRRTSGLHPDDVPPFRLNVIRGLDGDCVLDGPEHAADGDQTLCGISGLEVILMRHHFDPADRRSCPACASHVSG